MNTVINKEEVLEFLDLEHPLIDRKAVKGIFLAEQILKRNCLGDFYDLLLGAKIDHSNVDEYEPGQSYTAGNVVLYRGVYRQAKSSTSLEPNFSSDWKDASKFNDNTYNDLWENRGLGMLFASVCMLYSLPTISVQIRTAGVMKSKGGRQDSAPDINTEDLSYFYGNQAAQLITVVQDYMSSAGIAESEHLLCNKNQCTCSNACSDTTELSDMEKLFYGSIQNRIVEQCSFCQKRYNTSGYGVY